MAYATEAEFDTVTGLTVAVTRATLLLDLASDAIDEYVGFPLAAAAAIESYDGRGGKTLTLRRFPVSAVAAVTVIDTDGAETILNPDGFRWSKAGWLTRVGDWWPCHEQSVDVDYTAGYPAGAAALGVAKAVCIDLARREIVNPKRAESESIGDYSISNADVESADETGRLRRLRHVHVA